jgi:hypothetical protein
VAHVPYGDVHCPLHRLVYDVGLCDLMYDIGCMYVSAFSLEYLGLVHCSCGLNLQNDVLI